MTFPRLSAIELPPLAGLPGRSPADTGPPLKLVNNGRSASVIILADNAAPNEKKAAQELQSYLLSISGAHTEILSVPRQNAEAAAQKAAGEDNVPVLLGDAAETPALKQAILEKGNDQASFALWVQGDAVRVVGLSPEGTLFGTYELLEQLGVRWFMPGELGTVVPKTDTVELQQQQTIQVPSFQARWHGLHAEDAEGASGMWGAHVRMGGPYFPSGHGIPGISPGDFERNPEFFSVVNAKRQPAQLCVSNPEVVGKATEATKAYFCAHPEEPWIGMGPNDCSGFCECEKCRDLDSGEWDPFSNERSVTDRYIWFFNQVLAGISDEFPDKKIGFYCYHTYMRPPLKTIPNPRIVPAFAPISLCRVHGMSNPICPERSYYKALMEAWGKILPEVYERGYWYNLADPGFPFSEVHKIRDEIPIARRLGIKGWRVETADHWGSETPTLYIAAKLMWDSDADVDALLTDFYQKFFGPAKEPMAAYFTLMDAALRDGDHHCGSSFDLALFYPKALRDRARHQLTTAAHLAGSGSYGQRIKMFRGTFDYLETFLSMQQHASQVEFSAANRDLLKLDDEQKVLLAYDPPLLNAGLAPIFLKRFFRQPVEQGFARISGGNELAAALNDTWDFQIDPQKIGEEIGLWKATVGGGNWRPMKASASWSEQGLRTYKGQAWYRQEVDIPAGFAGKRLFLWFGGVDEKAKVWVNGQPLGISNGAAFIPFELDATEAARPGGKNVVAVCISNERVDELGTGGIVSPAMFYAPAAGAAAKLENVEELQRTFP